MSNYKILIKLTGSIAAYKSAYLISKLVQDGNEVNVVASEAALEFIGKATLEGLTANPVYTDSYEDGKMMSHINLVKWADLTIVCPASANTINKLANGIGDTLLTSLFLAHDWNKPYLIAPAMNTSMFEHPSTKESLRKLESWGVTILPTAEGYLACGDYGKGKLLEPEKIYQFINNYLPEKESKGNVLITGGGTKESLDGIREITNISTGKTASSIAHYFIKNNYSVTYLHAPNSALPSGKYKEATFTDFESLNSQIKNYLSNTHFDLVIHNAAVSDYSPYQIIQNGNAFEIPTSNKLSSTSEEMTLKLKRNYKILNKIKSYSINEKIKIVAFKFTNDQNENKQSEKAIKLINDSQCDLVVQNDFNNRTKDNVQEIFNVYDSSSLIKSVATINELPQILEDTLLNT
jgi:phosphopantothenoylcysteine decarboxylase/phosphopantothenate--cysteine ligase